eukprot:TRINITY_DN1912_c0_g1_i1.p1 TRINITY_DN1912_c0_g1~~TRINITY_DN1912_c0_g1_i1.p1  ORF type:complete len:385 (-),score=-57.06 TRINITY_DN1912_c0_g1_i1:64-1218(-)
MVWSIIIMCLLASAVQADILARYWSWEWFFNPVVDGFPSAPTCIQTVPILDIDNTEGLYPGCLSGTDQWYRFLVVYSGQIIMPISGSIIFQIVTYAGGRLHLNGELAVEQWMDGADGFFDPGADRCYPGYDPCVVPRSVTKGEKIYFELQYWGRGYGYHHATELLWSLDDGATFSIIPSTATRPQLCDSVCYDPHFKGFDNKSYDFQGIPGKVFALISDRTVQVNSLFISADAAQDDIKTFLGPTCIRQCSTTVVLFPNKTAFINNKPVLEGERLQAGGVVVQRPRNFSELIQINLRGWQFEVAMKGSRIDLNRVHPAVHWDDRTHGVLGHTLQQLPHTEAECNTWSQDGCEVTRSVQDYEVISGGLCGTDWKFSQFSNRACGI